MQNNANGIARFINYVFAIVKDEQQPFPLEIR